MITLFAYLFSTNYSQWGILKEIQGSAKSLPIHGTLVIDNQDVVMRILLELLPGNAFRLDAWCIFLCPSSDNGFFPTPSAILDIELKGSLPLSYFPCFYSYFETGSC